MSKTKNEHVLDAFDYLRISGLTTKPSPGEITTGLSRLEDMMSQFKSRNICSSYTFEDSPDPSTDSGIDPAHNEATATCLALRLAPSFGISINQEIRMLANSGLSNWSARSGKVNMIEPPRRQPRGSGNTFRFSNWTRYYRQGNNAPVSCSTFKLKVGEVDFFTVGFAGYLLEGETILSYTIESTNGVSVLSDAQDEDSITLECEGEAYGYQTVTVTITTSTGRVNPELINFNISDS